MLLHVEVSLPSRPHGIGYCIAGFLIHFLVFGKAYLTGVTMSVAEENIGKYMITLSRRASNVLLQTVYLSRICRSFFEWFPGFSPLSVSSLLFFLALDCLVNLYPGVTRPVLEMIFV